MSKTIDSYTINVPFNHNLPSETKKDKLTIKQAKIRRQLFLAEYLFGLLHQLDDCNESVFLDEVRKEISQVGRGLCATAGDSFERMIRDN